MSLCGRSQCITSLYDFVTLFRARCEFSQMTIVIINDDVVIENTLLMKKIGFESQNT